MVPAHDSVDLRSHPTPDLAVVAPSDPCSDLDLARRQLAAIDRWHDARRSTQEDAQRATASREARMDLGRRLDVIRAEHRAIVERTDAHLRGSVAPLRGRAARRAVVVHRNEWFMDKVAAGLGERHVEVVAMLGNGAEAVGAVLAEQPDLLLVEDSLPLTGGQDVVREVRAFSPLTRIGAQVADDSRIATMLEAGADSVWTRRVPPAQVAADLSDLILRKARRR